MNRPFMVAVDMVHDELLVANLGGHSITVYRRTASGNAAPLSIPCTSTTTASRHGSSREGWRRVGRGAHLDVVARAGAAGDPRAPLSVLRERADRAREPRTAFSGVIKVEHQCEVCTTAFLFMRKANGGL